jgi:hypothetical protein
MVIQAIYNAAEKNSQRRIITKVGVTAAIELIDHINYQRQTMLRSQVVQRVPCEVSIRAHFTSKMPSPLEILLLLLQYDIIKAIYLTQLCLHPKANFIASNEQSLFVIINLNGL